MKKNLSDAESEEGFGDGANRRTGDKITTYKSESSSESEESSTEEEEDEDAKEWTEDIEKTFLKTLSCLKKKDPKIYDENVKFFKEEDVIATNRPVVKGKSEERPLYLKDYERKIILEKDGILTDEESGSEDELKTKTHLRGQSPTYVEEQRILKENFRKFLHSDDEESEKEGNTVGFLSVKEKTEQEQAKEEEEYLEWLKGQKNELSDKQMEGELKYLRDYWTDPDLNDGEQFLRDFILNKRYLDPDSKAPLFESQASLSEDEKTIEEQDRFERTYNFRFEEPDKEFIKSYPRNIETSLRRKDEKRRLKRMESKMAREEKKRQKLLEIKKMKKLKKQEIIDKIKKLKEITGNEELGFNDEELDQEFNPDEYDKTMAKLFNDEFYDVIDEIKPQFSDDDDYEQNNETGNMKNQNEATDLNYEDPNFIMDCDYDPKAAAEERLRKKTRSSLRKGHKKTVSAQELGMDKPVFNPKDRTFEKYIDEYYNMDCEDVIGDVHCRYTYRKVEPNDFGLSIEEILMADDKELNNWCSMRKIDTIRPSEMEIRDKRIYSRKANNLELKRKILPSLFKEEKDQEENDAMKNVVKKKKKRRRKAESLATGNENDSNSGGKEPTPLETKLNQKRKMHFNEKTNETKESKFDKNKTRESAKNIKTWKNKNTNKNESDCTNKFTISDNRLKAYGINPKRFKNKLKYGPKKN